MKPLLIQPGRRSMGPPLLLLRHSFPDRTTAAAASSSKQLIHQIRQPLLILVLLLRCGGGGGDNKILRNSHRFPLLQRSPDGIQILQEQASFAAEFGQPARPLVGALQDVQIRVVLARLGGRVPFTDDPSAEDGGLVLELDVAARSGGEVRVWGAHERAREVAEVGVGDVVLCYLVSRPAVGAGGAGVDLLEEVDRVGGCGEEGLGVEP